MFIVSFEYHEDAHKWEVMVSGAKDATDAIQGFNAVIITTHEAIPGMHNKADVQPDGRYKISVGV